jgi:RNA polymerase sigma-70 factor (ECF subfamily)
MVRNRRRPTRGGRVIDSHSPYSPDFSAIYETLYPKLLRYFDQRCPAGQEPTDLAADTFADALRGRARFRGHTEAEAESWIWAIARTQLKMALRRRRVEAAATARASRQHPSASEDEARRIDDQLDAQASTRALADALGQLSREERQIIQMHVLEERPYPEIARALAMRDETARARGSRAVRKLARRVGGKLLPGPA